MKDVCKIDKGYNYALENGKWMGFGNDMATYHMVKEGFIKITYTTPVNYKQFMSEHMDINDRVDFLKKELKIKDIIFVENGGVLEGDTHHSPDGTSGGYKTGKFYFLESDMDF